MENLLFYDIEVFIYDALVIFKDVHKNTIGIFHNEFSGVLKLIKGKTLVGYNNYFYDDFILTKMIAQSNNKIIKQTNDRIIGGERLQSVHPAIKSLDCFQQIDPGFPSLKKIEGNLGKSIVESAISFDIDRKLTAKEVEETIFYCSYDIDTTIDIYKMREKSYFEPKRLIIDMLDASVRERASRWNTTTISANVLTKKPMTKWHRIKLGEYLKSGKYKLFEKAPQGAIDLWNSGAGKGKYVHKDFGCEITFGFGGLHGVPLDGQKRFKNVKLLDVASLYPNIIIKLNALGEATGKYAEIVKKRLAVKHTDKDLSDALKLVINSCYGLMKNEYSLLYNPNAALSVCVYGQIILYDLCKRLSSCCRIVNINTDGVAFTTDTDEYKTVWEEWQEEYGFILEQELYDTFIQKDVNNYLASYKGKIKCKGKDLSLYNKEGYFKLNNLRIVTLAVADKLLFDKDPISTIYENFDNPRLFQMILQAGNTYKGTFDNEGNKYQKVNRVFPIKKGGVTLCKVRQDDGRVRFPDTPDNMLVWNDECGDIKDFSKVVDINFYYDLVNKTLERWL